MVGDQSLEDFPPRPEGVIAEIAPAGKETIKGDVDWWRHQGVRVRMQEGAPGQEVLIKRGDFPVQEQRGSGQPRDRRGERPKSAGVVNAMAAQKADQAAALISQAPPAVILFLIDPARPMKRRRRARGAWAAGASANRLGGALAPG